MPFSKIPVGVAENGPARHAEDMNDAMRIQESLLPIYVETIGTASGFEFFSG